MSGSSLDGLDIAFCRLETARGTGVFGIKKWELLEAETLPFTAEWQQRLRQLPSASAVDFCRTDAAFGRFMGELVNQFLVEKKLPSTAVDGIASHGHTIFHEPAQGFTTQIGDGAALAATTGCMVVNNFRTSDVALGGQGAPLAPMADKMLFPGYDFYLNLGGIANITCHTDDDIIAFDVCGANQALNALANLLGMPYDEGGQIAAQGQFDMDLYAQINKPAYFSQPYPKSLANQWVQQELTQPCLNASSSIEDRMHTVCRHIAYQLSQAARQVFGNERFAREKYRMLATGGGVFNSYLMQFIQQELPNIEIVIPDENIVKFKEALLMALLGVMRLENVPNCMSSVTGAAKDAIGGGIWHV